jgi:hypothetical protein
MSLGAKWTDIIGLLSSQRILETASVAEVIVSHTVRREFDNDSAESSHQRYPSRLPAAKCMLCVPGPKAVAIVNVFSAGGRPQRVRSPVQRIVKHCLIEEHTTIDPIVRDIQAAGDFHDIIPMQGEPVAGEHSRGWIVGPTRTSMTGLRRNGFQISLPSTSR